MSASSAPTLITPRLRLRGFVAEDADDVYAYVSAEGFRRYLTRFDGRTYEPADARQFVSTVAEGPWGVDEHLAVELDGRVIGATHLLIEDGAASLGYGLGPAWWGQGLATEAVTATIDRAFDLGVEVVHARTDADNEASWRLLERLGFALDGVLRMAREQGGRRVDERAYSLLADEWATTRPPVDVDRA